MNTKKLLFLIACLGILMGSCADNEPSADLAVEGGKPSVVFSLGGAAKKTLTRASIAALDGEQQVNDLIAVLYNTHTGFYKIAEPKAYGDGEYQIAGLDDATYSVYFIVNASDALKTQLNAIPVGTAVDDPQYGLEQIIADQESDADGNFLMMCTAPSTVTTTAKNTESLGEIHIQRLAARFDIVNAADGVTINKVTYTNRAKKASLNKRNAMPTDADWFDASKVYNIYGGLTGSKAEPQEYAHEIYSYENYSVAGDQTVPVITIEYTANGVTRNHDVQMKDEQMNPLAIKRNNLYRIILSKGHDLSFDLQVADWDEAETFNVTDLPFEVEDPEEVASAKQREMNAKLWVNMFTEYNVNSIDGTNVSFYTEHRIPSTSGYYVSYIKDNTTVYKDVKGTKYKFPDASTLGLLAPYTTTSGYSPYLCSEQIERMIKNFSESLSISGKGTVSGNTELAPSKNVKIINNKSYNSVYGLRFKGSSQYSAYKWEIMDNFYISIKIKALANDSDMEISDIVDNFEFWDKDIIEYCFPCPLASNTSINRVCTISNSATISGSTTWMPGLCYNTLDGYLKVEKFRYDEKTYTPLRLVKVN